MQLTWITFPYGKGYDGTGITIKPLTFGELLAFSRGYSPNLPDVNRFLYLYNMMKARYADQVPLSKLVLPDIAYVMYYTFALSLTPDASWTATYKCECGKENMIDINPADIKFRVYDNVKFRVKLQEAEGELTFSLPTGNDLEKVLSLTTKYKKALPLEVAVLLAGIEEFKQAPNQVEQFVMNSYRRDAYIFMELMDMAASVFQPMKHKCECGNESYVKYADIIQTDFFRLFIYHQQLAHDKDRDAASAS